MQQTRLNLDPQGTTPIKKPYKPSTRPGVSVNPPLNREPKHLPLPYMHACTHTHILLPKLNDATFVVQKAQAQVACQSTAMNGFQGSVHTSSKDVIVGIVWRCECNSLPTSESQRENMPGTHECHQDIQL